MVSKEARKRLAERRVQEFKTLVAVAVTAGGIIYGLFEPGANILFCFGCSAICALRTIQQIRKGVDL